MTNWSCGAILLGKWIPSLWRRPDWLFSRVSMAREGKITFPYRTSNLNIRFVMYRPFALKATWFMWKRKLYRDISVGVFEWILLRLTIGSSFQESLNNRILIIQPKQFLRLISLSFSFLLRDPFNRQRSNSFLYIILETKGVKSTMKLRSITSRILVAIPRGSWTCKIFSCEKFRPKNSFIYRSFFVRETRSTALSYDDKREFMLIKLDGFFIRDEQKKRGRDHPCIQQT